MQSTIKYEWNVSMLIVSSYGELRLHCFGVILNLVAERSALHAMEGY